MDTLEEIKIIRKTIKSKPELKNVKIRNGQGTAWGWVEITGGPIWGDIFTNEQRAALNKYFNLSSGSNFAIIAPEDRHDFILEYCQ